MCRWYSRARAHGDGVVQRLGIAGGQYVLPRPGALRAREDRRRVLRGRAELASAGRRNPAGPWAATPRTPSSSKSVLYISTMRRIVSGSHVRPRARVRGGRLRGLRSRLRSLRGSAAARAGRRLRGRLLRGLRSRLRSLRRSRGARTPASKRSAPASKRSTPSSKRSSSSGDRRESRRSSGASVPPRLLSLASRFCAHAAESAPSVPAFAFASSALTRAARAAGSPVVRYSSAFCASEGAASSRAPSAAAARSPSPSWTAPLRSPPCPAAARAPFSRNGATAASYSSSSNTVSHARVYMVCGRKW